MDLSITLVLLLPFATSMAAPTALAQEGVLRTLINPTVDSISSNTNINNMFGNLALPSDQTIKPESIAALRDVLTAKVESRLMTSPAAFTPEMTSTAGFTGTNQLSQLNLSSGINNIVKLIVERLLESLMPRIFGQTAAPAPTPAVVGNPGFTGGFNFPGMFGPLGGMGMMGFSLMNNMFDFI